MEGDHPRGKGRDYLYDDYKELKEANELLTENGILRKTTMFYHSSHRIPGDCCICFGRRAYIIIIYRIVFYKKYYDLICFYFNF